MVEFVTLENNEFIPVVQSAGEIVPGEYEIQVDGDLVSVDSVIIEFPSAVSEIQVDSLAASNTVLNDKLITNLNTAPQIDSVAVPYIVPSNDEVVNDEDKNDLDYVPDEDSTSSTDGENEDQNEQDSQNEVQISENEIQVDQPECEGVRKRKCRRSLEKKKKDSGCQYTKRDGTVCEAKEFHSLTVCCKKKMFFKDST